MARKVVFLDRDGIINIERGEYTYLEKDFVFVPELLDAAYLWSKSNFDIIIISNQGGISKGIYSKKDVLKLDNIIRLAFVEKGIEVLDSFYCPHFTDNENCLCRKPKSLLLERAIGKYNINKADAFFIGDSERDVHAGENIGVKSFLVKANSSILSLSKKLLNE